MIYFSLGASVIIGAALFLDPDVPITAGLHAVLEPSVLDLPATKDQDKPWNRDLVRVLAAFGTIRIKLSLRAWAFKDECAGCVTACREK